jgi:serine/threonine protein phosphatase PrpC
MKYTWATATDVGHLREKNEDAVAPADDGSGSGPVVIAVADGMGGHAAGEVASRIAIAAATAGAPIDQHMAARVERANAAVLAAVDEDPSVAGMGTTMTIGVFEPNGTLHIGHVGDSRLYVMRGTSFEQVTTDHTWVMDLVSRGQISPADAATHPRKHLLSRVVGMAGVKADEIEFSLEPGDRVLFCSDGLTTMVSDFAIAHIMSEAETPSAAAWALIEAANAGGGVDNTTVAVVDVSA